LRNSRNRELLNFQFRDTAVELENRTGASSKENPASMKFALAAMKQILGKGKGCALLVNSH
jgi:hypothetical protein